MSSRERNIIKRAVAAARRKAHPKETGETPGSLTISGEKKRKRTRPVEMGPPGRTGPQNRPTPPVGRGSAQPGAKTMSRVDETGAPRPNGARRAKIPLPPLRGSERGENADKPPTVGAAGKDSGPKCPKGRTGKKRERDGNVTDQTDQKRAHPGRDRATGGADRSSDARQGRKSESKAQARHGG